MEKNVNSQNKYSHIQKGIYFVYRLLRSTLQTLKRELKNIEKKEKLTQKALKENKHDYKNKHVLDTLPTLKNQIDDINQYKTVYLIYPCWEKDEPLIIDSFCMDYDLSGKTIVPMCISEKKLAWPCEIFQQEECCSL